MSEQIDNPTRRLVAEAASNGRHDVRLDVNPSLAALSATLIKATPGQVSIGFRTPEWASQGNGVVGGGTLANMLDSAMAMATLSTLSAGKTCATISLTVNMLRSAALGELFVLAEVDKLGRRVAFTRGQLFDFKHALIATATSSLAIIDER